MRKKSVHGFQTGDLVRAAVPKGKRAGIHVGRVAVRATGSFNIQTAAGVVQGISYKHCRVVQKSDGYGYFFNAGKTTNFPISSHNLPSRSRAEIAAQSCG